MDTVLSTSVSFDVESNDIGGGAHQSTIYDLSSHIRASEPNLSLKLRPWFIASERLLKGYVAASQSKAVNKATPESGGVDGKDRGSQRGSPGRRFPSSDSTTRQHVGFYSNDKLSSCSAYLRRCSRYHLDFHKLIMSFDNCGSEIPFNNVQLTSEFWLGRLEATRTGALPAMYDQMKKTGRWDSLKLKWKPGEPHKPYVLPPRCLRWLTDEPNNCIQAPVLVGIYPVSVDEFTR